MERNEKGEGRRVREKENGRRGEEKIQEEWKGRQGLHTIHEATYKEKI